MSTNNRLVNRIKQKQEQFVMMPFAIFNGTLSAKAIAVFTYLSYRPDNWQFYETEIVSHFKDGLSAIKSALKELQENKFLIRRKIRNYKGQFVGYDYILYPDEKDFETEKPTTEKTDVGKSNVGFSDVGKSNTNHIDSNYIDNNQIEINQIDNKKPTKKDFFAEVELKIFEILKEKKLLTFKEKVNALKTKKEIKKLFPAAALRLDEVGKVAKEYANYIDRNRRKSARFNKWLIAYLEDNVSDIEYSKTKIEKKEIKPEFDENGRAIFRRKDENI